MLGLTSGPLVHLLEDGLGNLQAAITPHSTIGLPRSSGPLATLVQARSWRQRERAWRSWPGLRSRARGHKGLRCRRPIAERGVRTHGVVVAPPCLDDHLRLFERVEDLT